MATAAHTPEAFPISEQQSRSKTDAASRKNKDDGQGGDAGAMQAQIGTPAKLGIVVGLVCALFSLFVPSLREGVSAAAFRSDSDDLTTEFAYSCLFTLSCLGLVGVFDFTVGQFFVGRWFAVHTVVNAVLVWWCAADAFFLFTLPNAYLGTTCVAEGVPCAMHAPLCLSLALHLWHGLAYPLKSIDWVHHIPNWTLTSMCIYFQWGPMQGFSLFWALMGIPGMVDYGLLVGVKQKWVGPGTEKKVNEALNVWMRSPFCAITSFILIMSIINHPEIFVSFTHKLTVLLNGVHAFWNGQFFMSRTVAARTRYVLERKATAAQSNQKDGPKQML